MSHKTLFSVFEFGNKAILVEVSKARVRADMIGGQDLSPDGRLGQSLGLKRILDEVQSKTI